MALSKRIVDLRFVLGTGDFGEQGQNTVDLTGLRVSCTISKIGFPTQMECQLNVWGVPLDIMHKLTVLNRLATQEYRNNSLIVMAGDEDNGTAVAFQGTIWEAWADARNPPDVSFYVHAQSGMFAGANPIPPTSYSSNVDVALIASGIATQMGYSFRNWGVTGTIANAYYPGDARSQFEALCRDARCIGQIDDATRAVEIWREDQGRGETDIIMSADTGMIGYPSFTQFGVQVHSIYNPSIEFGRILQVESELKPAAGRWSVQGVQHYLDANLPDGQWTTQADCNFLGFTG